MLFTVAFPFYKVILDNFNLIKGKIIIKKNQNVVINNILAVSKFFNHVGQFSISLRFLQ